MSWLDQNAGLPRSGGPASFAAVTPGAASRRGGSLLTTGEEAPPAGVRHGVPRGSAVHAERRKAVAQDGYFVKVNQAYQDMNDGKNIRGVIIHEH